MGVLSGLPFIAAGNVCCCMWLMVGGVVAAYVLQQNETAPITAGDGATVGLLAGIAGSFVYLVLSIPVSFFVAPMEHELLQRLIDRFGEMPPDFREFASRGPGQGLGLMIGFVTILVLGAVFSTIGGVVGQAIFQKKVPPGTIDVTPPPAE